VIAERAIVTNVAGLDLRTSRIVNVIDSMTMSAPKTRVDLVVPKPTNRLGRKEPI
jgi:hypothetical protein